jgi:hypothetical protein
MREARARREHFAVPEFQQKAALGHPMTGAARRARVPPRVA